MSQYERGDRLTGTVRGGVPTAPRQRIDSLEAPGVVPEPPVVNTSAQELRDLGFALAGFGRSLGDAAAQVRFEREKQARDEARRRDEINAALEGQAAIQQSADMPSILTGIMNGSETRTLDEILAAQTDGLPTPAAEKYRQLATGRLAEAFAQRAENVRKQNVKANEDLVVSSAAGLTTPADLSAKVTALRAVNPDIPERMAQEMVAGAALNYQARFGDQAGLDAVVGFLPEGYDATQVAAAQGALDVRMTREQNARDEAARQSGYNAINQAVDGIISFDTAEQFVNDLPVDPGVKMTLKNQIQTERGQAMRRLDGSAFLAEQERVGSIVAAGLRAGQLPPDKFEVELPSGATKTIDIKNDVIPMVVEQEFASIDQSIPVDPLNPQAADAERLVRKAEYLNRLGGDVKYGPWERQLNSVAYLASKPDMTPETVPPQVLEAAALFQGLRRIDSSALINKHLSDESSRAMLESVDAWTNQYRAPLNQAIVEVSRRGPDRLRAGLDTRPVDSAALQGAVGDIGGDNTLDVQAALTRGVQFLRMTTGSADDATLIEQAKQDFKDKYTNIDGRWSYTAGMRVPGDVQRVSDFTKKMLGRDDIALTINPETGVAQYIRKDQANYGEVVDDAPLFTVQDLGRVSNYLKGLEYADQFESMTRSDYTKRRSAAVREMTAGSTFPVVPAGFGDRYSGELPPAQATPEGETAISKVRERAAKIPDGVAPEVRRLMEYVRDNYKAKPAISKERLGVPATTPFQMGVVR